MHPHHVPPPPRPLPALPYNANILFKSPFPLSPLSTIKRMVTAPPTSHHPKPPPATISSLLLPHLSTHQLPSMSGAPYFLEYLSLILTGSTFLNFFNCSSSLTPCLSISSLLFCPHPLRKTSHQCFSASDAILLCITAAASGECCPPARLCSALQCSSEEDE